jgi:hypothetical protein
MKRLSQMCLAVLLVAVLAAPGAAALKLSFKLSGGAALLLNGAGDLEKFRKGEEAYAADWAEGDAYSSTFSWSKLSLVPEFGGEVILHFTPKLGFGIGVGYVRASKTGSYTLNYQDSGSYWWGTDTVTETYTITDEFKGSAVPITFNFHFETPLSPKFNLVAYAGLGYYMGKLDSTSGETLNYDYSDSSWYYYNYQRTINATSTTTSNATCNKLGFQGGVGLEMLLTPTISVGVELYGRMVNFNGFNGDANYSSTSHERRWLENIGWYYDQTDTYSDSEKGNLYYWDWKWSYNNKYYAQLGISQDQPSGSSVSNVRKAEINLNRFGALVTIRFHFDL